MSLGGRMKSFMDYSDTLAVNKKPVKNNDHLNAKKEIEGTKSKPLTRKREYENYNNFNVDGIEGATVKKYVRLR